MNRADALKSDLPKFYIFTSPVISAELWGISLPTEIVRDILKKILYFFFRLVYTWKVFFSH